MLPQAMLNTARLWDVATGQLVREFSGHRGLGGVASSFLQMVNSCLPAAAIGPPGFGMLLLAKQSVSSEVIQQSCKMWHSLRMEDWQ